MQQFSLRDKVIIVTGGTGILGNSFVNAIVEAGGSVGILGRNEKVAGERAEAINKNGGKALALVADVMDEEQLKAAKEKAVAHFGKIDGLVNGAGGNMPEGVLMPGQDIFSMNLQGMKKSNGHQFVGNHYSNTGVWRSHCKKWKRKYRQHFFHELQKSYHTSAWIQYR